MLLFESYPQQTLKIEFAELSGSMFFNKITCKEKQTNPETYAELPVYVSGRPCLTRATSESRANTNPKILKQIIKTGIKEGAFHIRMATRMADIQSIREFKYCNNILKN